MSEVTVQITNTPLVIRNGSDVTVRITNTPITVRTGSNNVSLRIGGSPITLRFPASVPGNVAHWLDALGEYISDEEAIADGLDVGDWYITADGHVSAPSGIPKKIRAI